MTGQCGIADTHFGNSRKGRLERSKQLTAKLTVQLIPGVCLGDIAAVPGNKTYGGYTAKLGLYAQVTGRFEVPPRCFMPAPHVDSAVVRIDRVDGVVPEGLDREFVARVIDAAFAQRRKTIRNSMSANGFAKDVLDAAFEACGIAPTTRAETLDVADFVRLAQELIHDA